MELTGFPGTPTADSMSGLAAVAQGYANGAASYALPSGSYTA